MPQIPTTQTFETVAVDGGVTALIDFHADPSAPCPAQRPIIDELAVKIGTRAIVAKVDFDAESALAAIIHESALPTRLLFKDGRVLRRFTDRQTLAAVLSA